MLVLSRKPGERICLTVAGQLVTVEVLDHTGGVVRLGCTAPAGVTIDRAEVDERKRQAAALEMGGCDDD